MPESGFFTVGGTVQAAGGIYIPRKADNQLCDLCRRGDFAYVLTPRQMGKSSLMMRTAESLRADDIGTAIIDLTQIGVQVTREQWYLGLLVAIEDHLWLETDVIEWWQKNEHIGYTQRFTLFFEEVLIKEIDGRAVIFVDEIDTTLSLGFTDDFYGAIRYLYNSRSRNPELNRLSFVLIGVAMPGDLIADPQRTPFNVGRRVDLTDFTFDEARPLADGFNMDEAQAEQVLRWILNWTGGHPYLTQRLCWRVTTKNKSSSWTEADIENLVEETYLGEMSRQDNNLQFVRDMLTDRAPDKVRVIRTYERVRRGRKVADEEQSIVKSHLKLSGVVRRENGHLAVRNKIYDTVFDTHWIAEHRPPRYWTPVIQRIAAGAIVVLFIVSIITSIVALVSANSAADAQAVAEMEAASARQAQGTAEASEATADASARQAEQSAATAEADRQLANEAQEVAVEQANLAANALAGQLAAQSQVLASTNPQQSLLLALEGIGLTQNLSNRSSMTAQNALYQALGASSGQGFSIPDAAAVGITANSEWLFTTYRDGSLRAWDQAEPTAVPRILNMSSGPIAMSLDGLWLARGSTDGVLLWQTDNLDTEPIALQDGAFSYNRIVFSSDGFWLAAADSTDGEVYLWNLTDFSSSASIPTPYQLGSYTIGHMVFDFESNRLLISDLDQAETSTWILENLPSTPLENEAIEPDFISETIEDSENITFIPDSRNIIDGGIIGNPETGDAILEPPFSDLPITVSPDGKWLVTLEGSGPSPVLWSLDSLLETIQVGGDFNGRSLELGDNNPTEMVAFSNDSRWLAVGLTDGRVLLFDFQGEDSSIFSDDSPFASTGRILADYNLPGLEGEIENLMFSTESRWLFAISVEGNVRRWNIEEVNIIDVPMTLPGPMNAAMDASFLPESDILALSGIEMKMDNNRNFIPVEGVLEFWDTAEWPSKPQLQSRYTGLRTWVSDFEASSDGNWYATVTVSPTISQTLTPTIYLWQSPPYELEAPFDEDASLILEGPPGSATQLTFTPDNNHLIASDGLTYPLFAQFTILPPETIGAIIDSSSIYIWNLSDSDPIATRRDLTSSLDFINRLVVSPDGNWLAGVGVTIDVGTTQINAAVEIWDLNNLDEPGLTIASIEDAPELTFFNNLLFTPNNVWLFAALNSEDETSRVLAWNTTEANWTENTPQEVAASELNPFTIGISPDGRTLAVASLETLQLFNPFVGLSQSINTIPIADFNLNVGQITFSADSRWIMITDSTGSQALLLDMDVAGSERGFIVLGVNQDFTGGTITAAFSPENEFLVVPFSGSPSFLWPLNTEYLVNLACQTVGRNLTLNEWEQYLIGLDYHVTCPNYPPDPTAISELLSQGESLLHDGQKLEALVLYEQVVSAVQLSLDSNLAISVCNEAAGMSEDDLVAALLPACDWGVTLTEEGNDALTFYEVCAAGQGNSQTAAAVEAACGRVVETSLAIEERPVSTLYNVCNMGMDDGGELATLVEPICQAILTELPEEDNLALVYDICQLSTSARQNTIASTACDRIVELVSEDFEGLGFCFEANNDDLGQVAADICQASFLPYIATEDTNSLVPACIEIGEIQVNGNDIHACELMAEAAQMNGTAVVNNSACVVGLQEAAELAEAFLPACLAAVEMDPENGRYYAAYGVGLALTGDSEGALEALSFYDIWTAEFNPEEQEIAQFLINQVESEQPPDPSLLRDPLFSQEQTSQ